MQIEKEINTLLSFSDGVIANILYVRERTQEQYAILYWNGVKMENNRVFTKMDKELVEKLCKEVDRLTGVQNKLLEHAIKIQEKAENISAKLKEEEKDVKWQKQICCLFQSVNTEIDDLRLLYERYNREQKNYVKAVNNVTVFFKERFPSRKNTICDKFRKMLKKGETHEKEDI